LIEVPAAVQYIQEVTLRPPRGHFRGTAVQAFNRPNNEKEIRVNHEIVQRNATTIFQAARFYHPSAGTDVYWKYLTEDMHMDLETCKHIVQR
jgi:hypothetical protein